MSDSTGIIMGSRNVNSEENATERFLRVAKENKAMTPQERRAWYRKTDGREYGPGTFIGSRSGRVFLGPFPSNSLTREMVQWLSRPPSTPREPSGRSTDPPNTRGRRRGSAGSTTLLTADGLTPESSTTRRTVLGA